MEEIDELDESITDDLFSQDELIKTIQRYHRKLSQLFNYIFIPLGACAKDETTYSVGNWGYNDKDTLAKGVEEWALNHKSIIPAMYVEKLWDERNMYPNEIPVVFALFIHKGEKHKMVTGIIYIQKLL